MNRPLAHLAVVVVACVLTFWNTLGNGFHLDDAYRVTNNPGVEEFWPPWRHFVDPSTSSTLPRIVQYRPLLPLCLSTNYAISGESGFGFHAGNLLLQILASIAVYFFLRELFANWSKGQVPAHGALLITLLFAVHPVSGQPVNYVCARDLSMTVAFMMTAMFCYLRMRRLGATKDRWALCLGLLLLALLSKKNALVFPGLILLFETMPAGQRIGDGKVWRRALPFAAVVLGVLLFIRFGLGFSDLQNTVDGSVAPYFGAQMQHHVFHYLHNFAWPFSIRQLPAEPIEVWKQVIGGIVILASWLLAWHWRRTQPLIAFGILGYQVLLALTSSVIPMHSEIVPYRPYPASVFLYLGVGVACLRSARYGPIVLASLVVYFAVASVMMNPTWKDGETLFRHSVKLGGNMMAYSSLCDNLPYGEEKERLYLDVLAIHPAYAEAHIGLGMTEIAMGKKAAGLDRIENIVKRVPTNAQLRYSAAQALKMAGNLQEAANQAAKAVELTPDNPVYRGMATHFALDVRSHQKALELIQPLLQKRPGYQLTRLYAGLALQGLNRHTEAIPLFDAFVAQDRSRHGGWYSLATSLMALSDWGKAVDALNTCLSMQPNFGDSHNKLAECYRKLGNLTESNKHRLLYAQQKKKEN